MVDYEYLKDKELKEAQSRAEMLQNEDVKVFKGQTKDGVKRMFYIEQGNQPTNDHKLKKS